MTPDEKFLIAVYQFAHENGDFKKPVNSIAIGKTMGLKESGVGNTVKLLTKANFVLKVGDGPLISVTERGQKLVLQLTEKAR